MIRAHRTILTFLFLFFSLAGTSVAQAADDYQWTPWRVAGTVVPENPILAQRRRNNEFGVRYWYSSGEVSYNVAKPKISRLIYTADSSKAGEIYWRATGRSERYLLKGVVGVGGDHDGNVQDLDYNANGSTGSDTDSKIGKGRMLYAYADIGYKLKSLSWSRGNTSLLTGIGYFQDVMTARGLTCNQVGTGSFSGYCTAVGQVKVPYSRKVLQNDTKWTALRIGLENNYTPTKNISWRNEVAVIPYANFTNNDSHYLRSDLGSEVPNFIDHGRGYGWQAESTVDLRLSPKWSLNFGGRYWQFKAQRTKTKVGAPTVLGTEKSFDWDYHRIGMFAGLSYHF